jgi:hypothetical protein
VELIAQILGDALNLPMQELKEQDPNKRPEEMKLLKRIFSPEKKAEWKEKEGIIVRSCVVRISENKGAVRIDLTNGRTRLVMLNFRRSEGSLFIELSVDNKKSEEIPPAMTVDSLAHHLHRLVTAASSHAA